MIENNKNRKNKKNKNSLINKVINKERSRICMRLYGIALAMLFIGNFFGLLTMPLTADANVALENQELARIQRVLNSIYPMINAAEQQQMRTERVQFRYDWLRKDIASMQKGIQEKLNAIRVEPRAVKPLEGDYIDMKSSAVKNINSAKVNINNEQLGV